MDADRCRHILKSFQAKRTGVSFTLRVNSGLTTGKVPVLRLRGTGGLADTTPARPPVRCSSASR